MGGNILTAVAIGAAAAVLGAMSIYASETSRMTRLVAETVAKNLQYPVNKLTANDLTSEARAEGGQHILWVVSLKSSDNSFARTSILMAKAEAILTPELVEWCEKQILNGSGSINRVRFKAGAVGYAGLGTAGAGGSAETVVVTWPDRRVDIQLSLSVPREGLDFDHSTAQYYDVIASGGAGLTEKMARCVEHIMAEVERIGLERMANGSSSKPTSTGIKAQMDSAQPPIGRSGWSKIKVTGGDGLGAILLLGSAAFLALILLILFRKRRDR
jgi:LPXTG-motif cell wall-anchored protein